ncbi:mannose-6-phosphate receptor binding domain-containing protein [Auriculariales sp. MPI-PUGE-AT-0066]|nr:mannose-6-phosphate receptor binding domain-containing protein [Auriculariales sp. MPI-PUGE-AT-0066]
MRTFAFALATLSVLATLVHGADPEPCVLTKGGTRYDLRKLRGSKDYEFGSPYSDRKYKLNVCGSVKTEPWNVEMPENTVGASYRGSSGDFVMGTVNSTLDVLSTSGPRGASGDGNVGGSHHGGGLVMLMTGGSSCQDGGKAATAIRFVCDGGAGTGRPALVAQLPPDDDAACSFFVEWRTAHACPAYPGIGSFFSLILTTFALALFAILAYIVAFVCYGRFILNRPIEFADAIDSVKERLGLLVDVFRGCWDTLCSRSSSGRYAAPGGGSFRRGGGGGGGFGNGNGNGAAGGLRRGIPRSWQGGPQGYVGLPTDEERAGLLNDDDDAPVPPPPARSPQPPPHAISHHTATAAAAAAAQRAAPPPVVPPAAPPQQPSAPSPFTLEDDDVDERDREGPVELQMPQPGGGMPRDSPSPSGGAGGVVGAALASVTSAGSREGAIRL